MFLISAFIFKGSSGFKADLDGGEGGLSLAMKIRGKVMTEIMIFYVKR